jgi:hypothetical protein
MDSSTLYVSSNADFLSDSPYHEMLWLLIFKAYGCVQSKVCRKLFLSSLFQIQVAEEIIFNEQYF